MRVDTDEPEIIEAPSLEYGHAQAPRRLDQDYGCGCGEASF